jgi:hypothetical protein
MFRYLTIFIAISFISLLLTARERNGGFRFTNHRKSVHIQAKVSNNLVVIPMRINDSPPLYFILDTGVNTTLITEPLLAYMLDLQMDELVYVFGLGGEGVIEAARSTGNQIRIGSIQGEDMDLIVLPEGVLSFSELFGFPVYGIIGYDLFRAFPIEINYISSQVRIFRKPGYRIPRRATVVPFELIGTKPYVKTSISGPDGEIVTARLMVDLGASHPIYLNEEFSPYAPSTIPSFLGTGISGNLMGNLGRVREVEVGNLLLEKPLVAFPEQEFLTFYGETIGWNGLIGGGVLSRYRVTFDYPSGHIVFRENYHARDPFSSNLSGMEVLASGRGFNEYIVKYVRPGSVAYEAGIMAGDQIISVNNKSHHSIRFYELNEEISGEEGRQIALTIDRNGKTLRKTFTLREDILFN